MSRSNAVLVLLCRNDEFIRVKDISCELKVSLKTVYNSLNELDDFMKLYKYPVLIRDNKLGIKLDKNNLETNEILSKFVAENRNSFSLEERKALEMVVLILSENPLPIYRLEQILCVSRGSIINDLPSIKTLFLENKCSVETIPYRGLQVIGKESYKRNILIDCLYKHRSVCQYFIEKIGSNFDLTATEAILHQIEQELEIKFTDDSYQYLQLYLIVSIFRQTNGFLVSEEDLEDEKIKQSVFTKEYEICKGIAQLKQKSGYGLWTNFELFYLTQAVMSSKYYKVNEKVIYNDQWFTFQTLTNQFLVNIDHELKLDLLTDKEFFENLVVHIRSSCYRLMYCVQLYNPMTDMIKDKNKKLFIMIKKHLAIFENKIGIKFNDDEISYVVMYIAAMIERKEITYKAKQRVIAILCDSGMSTSWIIKKQIEAKYLVSIEGIYSQRELSIVNKNSKIDLIITTLPVLKSKKDYIVVNPILNEQDYELLDKKLEVTGSKLNIATSLIELCRKYIKTDLLPEFENEVYGYFAIEQKINQKKERRYPMLLELISEDLIRAKAKVKDRNEAIEKGGELLLQKGLIEYSYIEGMKKNVEENGPYIVIAPGIAIPHARPECGAKKIGFSIITLEEPIVFGHILNDPVKIMICLCAIDHQTHLMALSELIDILGNENKLNAILNADTSKEIVEIIAEKAKGGNYD